MPRHLSFPRPTMSRLGYSIKNDNSIISPYFIFREDCNTPHAAPITAPISFDPGPGVWDTINDPSARYAISSGKFRFTNISSGTRYYDAALPIVFKAGLLVFWKLFPNSLTTAGNLTIGLSTQTTSIVTGVHINFGTSPLVGGKSGAGGITNITVTSPGIDVSVESYWSFITRSAGAWYIYANKLIMVDDRANFSPLYPGFSNGANQTTATERTLDSFRGADLQLSGYSQFSDDWHLSSFHNASPAINDTFTHDADGHIEFSLPTLQSSGNVDIYFRVQSLSPLNGWCYRVIANTNEVKLFEIVNGVFTERLTNTNANGHINGMRFYVFFEGQNIRFYRTNTNGSAIGSMQFISSYTSATNFQSATLGKVADLGSTATISNLAAHPYNLPLSITNILDVFRNAV